MGSDLIHLAEVQAISTGGRNEEVKDFSTLGIGNGTLFEPHVLLLIR
jgi:hypothetical protein